MSNPPPASNPLDPVPAVRPRFSIRNVIVLSLPVLAIAASVWGYFYLTARNTETINLQPQVQQYLASDTKLDPQFTDADGDLVADRPEKTLDPDKLVFVTLEEDPEVWKGFCSHLEKRLKKRVEWRHDAANLREKVRKFKEAEVHMASFSTGTVSTMVNAGGFVPAFCMANDKGEYGYHATIVVPASSSVQSLKDLKGRTIALTSISSLSSFKAPIQVLWDAGLEIGKDYDVIFSRGQRDSIDGLAKGRYQAIATASDLLQRMIATNNLDSSKFRTLYKSKEEYPPACFGYHHALKKELSDAIRSAFLDYPWDDRLKKEFSPAGYTKFVPISYKQDWAPVRQIDEHRIFAGK